MERASSSQSSSQVRKTLGVTKNTSVSQLKINDSSQSQSLLSTRKNYNGIQITGDDYKIRYLKVESILVDKFDDKNQALLHKPKKVKFELNVSIRSENDLPWYFVFMFAKLNEERKNDIKIKLERAQVDLQETTTNDMVIIRGLNMFIPKNSYMGKATASIIPLNNVDHYDLELVLSKRFKKGHIDSLKADEDLYVFIVPIAMKKISDIEILSRKNTLNNYETMANGRIVYETKENGVIVYKDISRQLVINNDNSCNIRVSGEGTLYRLN